jgi:hypothetical protein
MKYQKMLKNDFIFLIIIRIIVLALMTFNISIFQNGIESLNLLEFFIGLVFLIIGVKTADNGLKIAGIIGIVYGVLMIITLSLFDLFLGLFLVLHSISYLKFGLN